MSSQSNMIVIIDDDQDDQEVIAEVFGDLKTNYDLVFFTNCKDALQYLRQNDRNPFLIICDINLPGLNGIECKKCIDADIDLRKKSIPFVFLSTAANKIIVNQAFGSTVAQGFFEKSADLDQFKRTISAILLYWELSKHAE